MAISKIKKAIFFVHKDQLSRFLEILQKTESVHLENISTLDDAVGKTTEKVENHYHDIDTTLRAIADIQFAIKFLKQFEGKRGALEKFLITFMGEKMVLSEEDYEHMIQRCDFEPIIKHCRFLDGKLQILLEEKRSLLDMISTLTPWESVRIPLNKIMPEKDVIYILGSFKEQDYQEFLQKTKEKTELFVINTVQKTKQRRWIFLAYHPSINEEISSLLKVTNCEISRFQNFNGTAKEEIASIKKKLSEMNRLEKELIQEAQSLFKYRKNLMALYDFYFSEKLRYEASNTLSGTQETVLVSGWIPEEDLERTEKQISKELDEVMVSVSDPASGEEIPIELENNFFDEPFRPVIAMYGMPNKKELDPTPFVAPFFAFFFGICLTDAGYGILLMITTLILLKFMKIGNKPRLFFRLFFFGGFFALLCGLLTGGWFGINFDQLPAFLKKFVILKPLEDPVTFLLFCLGLGFLHILLGLFIGFIELIREKQIAEAIFQKLTWIFLLLTILVFALGKMKILPVSVVKPAKWGCLILVGTILFFTGFREKNILKRVGIGAFALYGSIGFLGDILSYSRLMALGLATGCIAMVINMIAGMVFKIPIPVLNIVAVVLLLVIGHIGNIAINTLGGFVHTARLQFLEFFSKFFIGGGKPFRPFKKYTKFVYVEENNRK